MSNSLSRFTIVEIRYINSISVEVVGFGLGHQYGLRETESERLGSRAGRLIPAIPSPKTQQRQLLNGLPNNSLRGSFVTALPSSLLIKGLNVEKRQS